MTQSELEQVPTQVTPIRGIDHVGIAVHSADEAAEYYVKVLGLRITGDEIANDPGVRLMYLGAGEDRIQLVEPFRDGPVRTWLAEHGEGLHHVCLQVDDIAASLPELSGQSADTIFRGGRHRKACFLTNSPQGVLVELTETMPS